MNNQIRSKNIKTPKPGNNLFLPSFPSKSPQNLSQAKKNKKFIQNKKAITLTPIDQIKTQISTAIHGIEKSKFNLARPKSPAIKDMNTLCTIQAITPPPVKLKLVNLHFKNLSMDSATPEARIIFPSLRGSSKHDSHVSNNSPLDFMKKSPILRNRLTLLFKKNNRKLGNAKQVIKTKRGYNELRSSRSFTNFLEENLNETEDSYNNDSFLENYKTNLEENFLQSRFQM
ncbi:unnamed protein product [Blepharisma stoltei]|uniref:Uncharacterized protein n=1 Tax=Blepharisma stoltei TaxID=1481888 RepID=A0AAU9IKW5_9CILI|nr:unnamed protein product [Blepharisma stoltei]